MHKLMCAGFKQCLVHSDSCEWCSAADLLSARVCRLARMWQCRMMPSTGAGLERAHFLCHTECLVQTPAKK